MGPRHGETGRAFVGGVEIGTYELEDSRHGTMRTFAIAGTQNVGHAPGRVTGEVRVIFTEIHDDGFREQLETRRQREQRIALPAVDLSPHDGASNLIGCAVGFGWGAPFEPLERIPFSLSLPD